ncbi:MAG TPA: DUF4423 domain-containing protein, partial [Bdellovibrionales bacterium]|nr:DUF4423 domain-containing protein [Bdellovibrionales bacterium]
NTITERPDVFLYTDYKAFIKDMIEYFRGVDSRFSIRKLAKESGISNGYLTIIFKTPQQMAEKTLVKIIPSLRLSTPEGSYLRILRDIADPESPEHKAELLKRLQKFHRFREEKPDESQIISYLEKWYNIAIRELASDPEFKLDPAWIRERLQFPVHTADVERGIETLLEKGFIQRTQGKGAEVTTKRVACHDQIFSMALANVHRQFFRLASESIDFVPREQRNIQGHIMSLDQENFEKAKQILGSALEQIANLQAPDRKKARVFNFSFLAFPLTKTTEEAS